MPLVEGVTRAYMAHFPKQPSPKERVVVICSSSAGISGTSVSACILCFSLIEVAAFLA